MTKTLMGIGIHRREVKIHQSAGFRVPKMCSGCTSPEPVEIALTDLMGSAPTLTVTWTPALARRQIGRGGSTPMLVPGRLSADGTPAP